jgi:hypothetical protein
VKIIFLRFFIFCFTQLFLALDPSTYPNDKIKFISENDYDDSNEELFNRDTTQLQSDIPESFIVELQNVAKDQSDNVIKSSVNEALTTPQSIYDFQGKISRFN